MAPETISRWARRYALVSAAALLAWQAGVLADIPREAEVTLAVYGFLFPMVFGKAYSLVPTYFDADLAFPRAPGFGFPFAVVAAGGLALAALGVGPPWLASVGALSWVVAVAVFVGSVGWTVRHNLTGRFTATGGHNAERQPVDRLANAFVPLAVGYLLVGTYGTLALHTGLPPLVDGYPPRLTHLLAAGAVGVLVFALGFRLLPRFFSAPLPRWLAAVVLVSGATGPALLALGIPGGPVLRLGALVEAGAVGGFGLAVALLFRRSARRRVGLVAVLVGAGCGLAGVALGVWLAFVSPAPALVRAHLRLNLLGFLGLTVVGVTFQFYPPAVGTLPGADDRTARLSILALAGGLLAQVGGLVGGVAPLTTLGQVSTLVGACCFQYLLGAAVRAR